ncbi:retrotransposon protein, putative, ty1-copia subclass [Tanacetum coccineum]
MNAEMQSMKDNQVWNLVDLPPNCKTVRSKWIFKKKTNMDVNINTYKAYLVAKGFTQTYGVDYEETFSPVVDIKAIRILIAIAAYYNYEIWQMDVRTIKVVDRIKSNAYIDKILKQFKKDTSKRGTIPMQPNGDLSKSQGPSTPAKVMRMKGIPYALIVVSIMYAVRWAEYIAAMEDNNLVDPFTKPMPCTKHVEHARSIGLGPTGGFM